MVNASLTSNVVILPSTCRRKPRNSFGFDTDRFDCIQPTISPLALMAVASVSHASGASKVMIFPFGWRRNEWNGGVPAAFVA